MKLWLKFLVGNQNVLKLLNRKIYNWKNILIEIQNLMDGF